MELNNYIKLINPQLMKRKRYGALVRGLAQIFFDTLTFAESLKHMYDVDQARGVFLDLLGEIVGVSRVLELISVSSLMDDDTYRKIIKSKIAINTWDGTMGTLPEILNSVFPELNITVTDHQNMTVTAIVRTKLSDLLLDILNNGLLIPRTYGVEMKYVLPTQVTDEVIEVKRGNALVSFMETKEE